MNAIAESNAAVSDIQHPKFRDVLKEDLELKGISEKQFMFLLRKHTVGFAGRAVTRADSLKASQNMADVDSYLDASTKDDFLLKAGEDALLVGKSLPLDKLDEKYILDNFAEANRKISLTETVKKFKNLFNPEKNKGENQPAHSTLDVIDEDKCTRVMKRINDLGLNKGSIDKKIIDEKFFDKNFSADFFEDMVNAQNYCMIFEQGERNILQLDRFENEIKNYEKPETETDKTYKELIDEYDNQEKTLDFYDKQLKEIKEKLDGLNKKLANKNAEMGRL